jgi:pimeloyl-ACP methyl ester carboxylesterase
MGMKGFFFKKKGLYYRKNEFKPKRPTLFFVHGLSGSSSAWLTCERAFENDYNVLSLDLRGHGKSVRLGEFEDYAIPKFSEDLRELLEYCGVKKCVLVSNSFGTFVALDFIGKHQNMVSSAIFIGPHFAIGKMRSAWLVKLFLALAVKMKPKSSPSKAGGHVDYSKYADTGDWNVRRTIADVKNTGLWVFLYAMAHAYDFDGENILKKIKVPTLIIHGAKDTIIPLKYGVMMAKKIRNSKLVVLDDIDHIIVLNRSKKVIEIIGDFLEKLKSGHGRQ